MEPNLAGSIYVRFSIKLLKYLCVMLLGVFLFVVAKGLPNVGAVQVGNLDVTLKDVCVKRLQCCVTVDVTQTLLVTINKLL